MSKRFYPGQETPEMSAREREHRELVRQAAAECMVLLENDGILPLKPGARLALFGRGARRTIKGGTGSGDVNSREVVSIEQGLEDAGYEIITKAWIDRDCDCFNAATARRIATWVARRMFNRSISSTDAEPTPI